MDLLTFQDRFSDERDCYEHLKNLKWPDGFQCPDCGSNDHFEQWQRKLTECRECGRQVYWRQGTIFENSNLPLRKWFWAIYLITELKKSLSRLELSRRLDVTYKTATRMANLIQSVMGQADSSFFLSGTWSSTRPIFTPGIREPTGPPKRANNPCSWPWRPKTPTTRTVPMTPK